MAKEGMDLLRRIANTEKLERELEALLKANAYARTRFLHPQALADYEELVDRVASSITLLHGVPSKHYTSEDACKNMVADLYELITKRKLLGQTQSQIKKWLELMKTISISGSCFLTEATRATFARRVNAIRKVKRVEIEGSVESAKAGNNVLVADSVMRVCSIVPVGQGRVVELSCMATEENYLLSIGVVRDASLYWFLGKPIHAPGKAHEIRSAIAKSRTENSQHYELKGVNYAVASSGLYILTQIMPKEALLIC